MIVSLSLNHSLAAIFHQKAGLSLARQHITDGKGVKRNSWSVWNQVILDIHVWTHLVANVHNLQLNFFKFIHNQG